MITRLLILLSFALSISPVAFSGDARFISLHAGRLHEVVSAPGTSPELLELSEPLASPRLAFSVRDGVAFLDGDNVLKVIHAGSGQVHAVRRMGAMNVRDLTCDGADYFALVDEGVVRLDPFASTVVLPARDLDPGATSIVVATMSRGNRRLWVGSPAGVRTYEAEPGRRASLRRVADLPVAVKELDAFVLRGVARIAAVLADDRMALLDVEGKLVSIISPSSPVEGSLGDASVTTRLATPESGTADYVGWPVVECDYYGNNICCVIEGGHWYCWNV